MAAWGRTIRAAAALVLFAVFAWLAVAEGEAAGRISSFGRYEGWSEARYDGSRRTSGYLPLADGTQLAYDLILPTRDGEAAGERLPVLFKYTPYLRTWTIFDEQGRNRISDFVELGWLERSWLRLRYWLSADGRYFDPVARTPWLKTMLAHGYAVLVVERPGTGASFGQLNASFEVAGREADQVIDWIAAQPWSDGRIGMFGDSFQAMMQFAAAASGNPHLRAIFPAAAPYEVYDAIQYRGGVFNKGFSTFFAGAAERLETLVTPVDADPGGRLLAQALEGRRNATMKERLDLRNERFAFRDSLMANGQPLWREGSLYAFTERINRAGVPVYMTSGWNDLFTGDMFLWWHNLTVPKRLAVRPLDHTGMDKDGSDLDYAAEALRWFDHWLRGIDNGIMDEAPLHWYRMGPRGVRGWQAARDWPPPAQALPFHFAAAGEERPPGVGGSLQQALPAAGEDAYTVDYATTSGTRSRWTAVNFPHDYGDLRGNDARAVSYTTAPLHAPLEVTGHPIARVWLESAAPDLDLFVYLEEEEPDGASRYVTEGTLRASHRALSEPPFRNFGLPFHSHYRADLRPLVAGQPAELALALLPVSRVFAAGHRIRVTVAFADADNFATPVLQPPPQVRILRGGAHASRVELPVVLAP